MLLDRIRTSLSTATIEFWGSTMFPLAIAFVSDHQSRHWVRWFDLVMIPVVLAVAVLEMRQRALEAQELEDWNTRAATWTVRVWRRRYEAQRRLWWLVVLARA